MFNKYKYFVVILIICFASVAFGQTTKNEKLKDEIWKFQDVANKNFSNSHKKFEIQKTVKGKTIKETYIFSQSNNSIEKLVFESLNDNVKEVEEYYFNKGELVLAGEIVYFKYENDLTDRWSVILYIKEGKVFDMMSNGHGKTEDDEWEPKPLEMSKKRIKALKRHLKKINL